jgi:hypothetical protein
MALLCATFPGNAGYTGPFCATCSSESPSSLSKDDLLLKLGINSSTLLATKQAPAKQYGRYRNACHACPSNKALALLAYIGARVVDLVIVAVLVWLIVRERKKRMHKQANSVLHTPKSGTPGAAAAVGQSKWPHWAERMLPSWFRSSLAAAPLLRKEAGPVPKRPEIAADALVQVSASMLGRLGVTLIQQPA